LREHGKPVPREAGSKPITLSEFAKTFLDHRKTHKKPATYRDYENTLRLHIVPYIGTVKLAELSDEQIKAMYRTLESKVSPSMRKRVHVTLRALLNYGLECKAIKSSPLATIRQDVPRYKKQPVRPLDEPQVARLLKAAKGDRLESLFILALDSGARQGELFALEWRDLDLKKGMVYIQRAASETPDGIVVGDLKTEKSRRNLPITKGTIKALQERRTIARREGLANCEFVFPSERGHVMRKSNFIRRVWEPIRKAAGIPSARFHDLRHTTATMLCRANQHPRVIQDRLGHASIVQTMDTYSAWLPSMQTGAAKALEQVLGRLSRQKAQANLKS
jgi:integrase